MLIVTSILAAVVAAAGISPAQTFRETAFPLLQRLNGCVVSYQNTDVRSGEYGGIICPGENLYHTRAAEAMFPLAYEYSQTGDRKRLAQTLSLADWLIARQEDDGSWKETPEEWTGTTTDQLLMMLLTYPLVKNRLTRSADSRWLSTMRKAADYLARVMDNRFASINYCATTTATLAEAQRLLGEQAYLDKARSLAHMIVGKMNFDHFIVGEGEREGPYKYGVDIGYNIEMSLWGLARYAQLSGDEAVMDAVRLSAEAHLPFIYPDGMLDASSGIRSNKWTLYGSGTSDGIHPLCALLSGYDSRFLTASMRNLGFLEGCFSHFGPLATGPGYDAVMSTPPCIYPSFTKAKSIAMALAWLPEEIDTPGSLPTDSDYDVFYQTLRTAIVRRGPYCTTICASNYKARAGAGSKYMHRPAGGALGALWIEGYGLLTASSQTEYHRWEPMSFPVLSDVKPLTPRLESADGSIVYTNLYEFDSSISYESSEDVRCCVTGELKDRDQLRSGASYRLSYTVSDRDITKRYEVLQGTHSGEVVAWEPIVCDAGLAVEEVSGQEILLRREGASVRISVSGPSASISPVWDDSASCRQVYPALRALPLRVRFTGSVEIKIEKI